MAKLAALIVVLAISLAALGWAETPPTPGQACASAIAQAQSRLLKDHTAGEARRIASLEVASSLPQCR